MKTTLILIRHGETEKNITGTIHGKNDLTTLTDVGKYQMEQAAKALVDKNVESLYCSDTLRTKESADIICANLGLTKNVISGIHERCWGELEETPWEEVEKMLNDMKLNDRYEYIPKDGESWKEVETRAALQIKKVISNGDRCIAVVTHGGVIRALIPWLLKGSKEDSLKNIANGSISTFIFEDEKVTFNDINNTDHIK